VEEDADHQDTARLIFYSASIDGKLESATKPAARCSPAVFEPAVPGILGQEHVELIECVYQRFQGSRSHSTVQGTAKLSGFLVKLSA
jgi:hypothetical protein